MTPVPTKTVPDWSALARLVRESGPVHVEPIADTNSANVYLRRFGLRIYKHPDGGHVVSLPRETSA